MLIRSEGFLLNASSLFHTLFCVGLKRKLVSEVKVRFCVAFSPAFRSLHPHFTHTHKGALSCHGAENVPHDASITPPVGPTRAMCFFNFFWAGLSLDCKFRTWSGAEPCSLSLSTQDPACCLFHPRFANEVGTRMPGQCSHASHKTLTHTYAAQHRTHPCVFVPCRAFNINFVTPSFYFFGFGGLSNMNNGALHSPVVGEINPF